MRAYILRRLLIAIPVILLVAVFAFALVHFAPGDPALILAGGDATPEEVAAIRAQLGLDQPLVTQFAAWGMQVLNGDLGTSYYSKLPIETLLAQRLEPTISLTVLTLLMAVAIGVPIGVLAAWRSGSWFDRLTMGFSVLGFSLPAFVLGYLLVLLFAMELHWLPVQGYAPLAKGVWPWLRCLILPSFTVAVTFSAAIARMTRTTMLDVLGEDYIRTAYAKGLATPTVLTRHALRAAAVPIVTIVGVGLVGLLNGVVIAETVFAVPGLGRLAVDAVLARDYPIIQGVVIVFTGTYIVVNLLIDISYAWLDPRIRY
jgi:peptide/nickel transport system permease protein